MSGGGSGQTATRRKRLRLAVAAALIVGALGYVIAEGLGSALVYFQTAAQAVHDRAMLGSQDFNIEGAVVPGSIRRAGTTVDFEISSGKTVVPVVSHGSPPQLFQNGIPVVLVGHFANVPVSANLDDDPCGGALPACATAAGLYFDSQQIMVKHSSEYVAAHPTRVTSPYSRSSVP